ncbi:MAG: hypothetical protein ABI592_04405 [Acidobacteriota bacterium]
MRHQKALRWIGAALMTAVLSSSVSGAQSSAKSAAESASTRAPIELVASPLSEVPFAKLQATLQDDGRYLFQAEYTVTPDTEAGKTALHVNMETGEYTATFQPFTLEERAKFEKRTAALREIENESLSRPTGSVKDRMIGSDGRPPIDNCDVPVFPNACEGCRSNWTVSVVTHEPAYFIYPELELNRTTRYASWGYNGGLNGCRYIETQSGGCAVTSQSSFNTHWFLQSCQNIGPLTIGNYYNDDFLLSRHRVTVYSSAGIVPQGAGQPIISVNWFTGGDPSRNLLFVILEQSGYINPYCQ